MATFTNIQETNGNESKKTKSVHIKGKRLNIYLEPYVGEDKDLVKEPKIIITYLVNTNTGELINEKVRFWKDITQNKGGERYYGETPLIFVRKDLIENTILSVLDVANLLLYSIKNIDGLYIDEITKDAPLPELQRIAKTEKDIIRVYKRLAFKKKWLNYGIETFKSNDVDVLIKRPHKDYVVFEEKTFTEVATRFQIETTRKNQKKAKELK